MSKKPEPVEEVANPYECPHDTLTVRKLTISRQQFTKQPKTDARDIPKFRSEGAEDISFQEILTVYCKKCGEPLHTKVLN